MLLAPYLCRRLRPQQATRSGSAGLRGETNSAIGELRGDMKSLHRTMLYGFFTLAGLIVTYAGFQLS